MSHLIYFNGFLICFWYVQKDETKAENPFLTRSPTEIYKTTDVDVDALIGVNTAVSFFLKNFYLIDLDKNK